MTDRKRLAEQLRGIAWGYCFLYLGFNINFNSVGVDLLADFVGWWRFEEAIPGLKEERPKLMLLQGFARVLLIWSVLEWLPFLHVDQIGWLAAPRLLLRLMALYFHFQLLTELSELARQQGEEAYAPGLLTARTMAVLLQTALVLLAVLPIPEVLMSWVGLALLLVQLVVCIYTMSTLFSLAKALREPKI